MSASENSDGKVEQSLRLLQHVAFLKVEQSLRLLQHVAFLKVEQSLRLLQHVAFLVKLLNERSDHSWFCQRCTKPALHAVFVEKDIEERCQIFFETVEKRIKKLKKIIHLSLALWKP